MKRRMLFVPAIVLALLVSTSELAAAGKTKRSFWAFAWSELKEDARLTWIGMKSGVYTCTNILTGDMVGASVEVAGVVGKVAEEYTGESNPLSEAVGHGKAGIIIIATDTVSRFTGNDNIAKAGKAGATIWEFTDALKLFKNGGIKRGNLKLLEKRGAIAVVGETERMDEIRAAVAQVATITTEGADLVIRGLSESEAKNSAVTVREDGNIIEVVDNATGDTLRISHEVLDTIIKTYRDTLKESGDQVCTPPKETKDSLENRLPMDAPGGGQKTPNQCTEKPVTLAPIEIVR